MSTPEQERLRQGLPEADGIVGNAEQVASAADRLFNASEEVADKARRQSDAASSMAARALLPLVVMTNRSFDVGLHRAVMRGDVGAGLKSREERYRCAIRNHAHGSVVR